VEPLPSLTAIPADVVAVSDYAPLARERMTEAAWAFVQGGAGDELTLRDNEDAFARLRLMPRVLHDLGGGDTAVTLFGHRYPAPILLAPVAFQQLAHPDGEAATVLAASAMHTGMVVSTQSGIALETLATQAQAPLWFQLYIQPDRDFTARLVERAQSAGVQALVVTVDAPIHGARNREQRAGFALPPGISPVNLAGMRALPAESIHPGGPSLLQSQRVRHAPTWQELRWLRALTRLPLVLKGILHPDDARLALEEGVDAVIVSNHGGRTLDTVPASIDALPAVAEAIAGRIPLLLDGGIHRGTDVFKALALGASAVLVGRAFVHGLAAAGAPGVAHVLHLLRTELEMAMVLAGCRTLADIDCSRLWPAQVPPFIPQATPPVLPARAAPETPPA